MAARHRREGGEVGGCERAFGIPTLLDFLADARAADLLFQVITRRYEKRSLVLTTNLPFSDWPMIFPNAGSAVALIDGLVHHAEIIPIEGDSYRRRVAEAKRKSPRPAAES